MRLVAIPANLFNLQRHAPLTELASVDHPNTTATEPMDPSLADDFTLEAFTLMGIGTLIVVLRVCLRARQVGIRHLQADDYFMLGALIFYVAGTATVYIAGVKLKGLDNSSMTNVQRASLDPISEEYRLRVAGSKIQVAGWCGYTTILWLVKASLCSFYLRLTASLEGFETWIKVGFVLLAVTYITVICAILFSCRPMSRFWQIYPDPGTACQPAYSRVYLFMILSLNLSTDLYLILIPMPVLWRARLPLGKKLGLTVLFSGALFVMTAGALRCILTLKNPVRGPALGAAWALREGFVAIVTSNLPMIWVGLRQEIGPTLKSQPGSGHQGSDNIIMLTHRKERFWRRIPWKKAGVRTADDLPDLYLTPQKSRRFEEIDVSMGNVVPPSSLREDSTSLQGDARVGS